MVYQPTLFEMRWSPSGSNQYAADVRWAATQAGILAKMFEKIGYDGGNNFRYPMFKG